MHLSSLSLIRYKRLWFSVNDNFLSKDVKLDADINYCIQVPENVNGELNEFHTPLIDLNQPGEKIYESFHHQTRTQISSFISNQKFEYQLTFDITEKDLRQFMDLYNGFAKYKKIRKAEEFRLRAFNKNKLLAISFIKQNNNFICINFYRVTKQRATNISSFHLKHLYKNLYSSSHFGRAHRAIHWLDIQQFKKIRSEYYDFCGWYHGSENETLLNINKFKEQFTKNIVKEYSGVIYRNKLLAFLKKLR